MNQLENPGNLLGLLWCECSYFYIWRHKSNDDVIKLKGGNLIK